MLSSPFWIVVNNTLNQNGDAGSKTRKISETVKNKLLEEHEKMPEQRLDSETQSAGIKCDQAVAAFGTNSGVPVKAILTALGKPIKRLSPISRLACGALRQSTRECVRWH